jgi:hypothetical protein
MVPGYQNFAAASWRAQKTPIFRTGGEFLSVLIFVGHYAWQSNLEQLSFCYLVTFRTTRTGSSALSVQLQTKSSELA